MRQLDGKGRKRAKAISDGGNSCPNVADADDAFYFCYVLQDLHTNFLVKGKILSRKLVDLILHKINASYQIKNRGFFVCKKMGYKRALYPENFKEFKNMIL